MDHAKPESDKTVVHINSFNSERGAWRTLHSGVSANKLEPPVNNNDSNDNPSGGARALSFAILWTLAMVAALAVWFMS